MKRWSVNLDSGYTPIVEVEADRFDVLPSGALIFYIEGEFGPICAFGNGEWKSVCDAKLSQDYLDAMASKELP